jgi:hypothetical protein
LEDTAEICNLWNVVGGARSNNRYYKEFLNNSPPPDTKDKFA